MNITLDVYDIASKEEIKEAALDAVRSLVTRQFSGSEENLNRLLTNLSYSHVVEMVNRQYDGKLEALLKEKVTGVINELSAYTVFQKKNAWEHEDSVAYKALQEEMALSRPLIKARVEQIIQEYPFHELEQDEIGDVVYQCIMGRLFSKEQEATHD